VLTDQPVCIGDWCPRNYGGRYSGRVTLTDAIARSLNSIPVQLTQAVGRERVAKFAQMFGLPLPNKPEWPFVIGAVELKVVDQAVGYAAFANGGLKVEPMTIEQITDGSGAVLWDRRKNGVKPKRIMPEEKVEQINQMMNAGVEQGTGTRARLDGIPAAGKTGTTQSSRDAWFCGYTGNYVGVVWVGNDDYRPMERVTGGVVPAPIWHDIMEFAHANIDLKQAPGLPAPARKPGDGGDVKVSQIGTEGGSSLIGVAGTAAIAPDRPKPLSNRSVGVLTEIEVLMRSAPPVGPRQGAVLMPIAPANGSLSALAGARGGLIALR
jgi:penicillin-binding protein 1A